VGEAIGPLVFPILVVLVVVVVCIVVVTIAIAFVVFAFLGAAGFVAISERAGRAKRRASEAGPEEAW
jgi:hypothetical protein